MTGRTKAIVSVGLLALLFWILPWSQLEEAFRRLSLRTWLGLLAGFVGGHLLGVVKWRTVVNAGRARLGFRDAIMCYGAGLFTNLCLPTIVGGDILRLTMASRITRNPAAVTLGGVTDRLSDILALGILLALGLLLSTDQLPGLWGQVITVVVVVGAVLAMAGLPFVLQRPLARWPKKFRRPIGRLLVALRHSWKTPSALATALALSLVIQGGFVLLNVALGRSIGIGVDLSVWLIAWPAAKVAGLLPISLGGLAVREASLGALLLPFGVPMATGVAASLIWQTVLIGGGLIGGATWVMLRPSNGGSDSVAANAEISPTNA
ncbi:MAG: flippase-like domain-containing protein [Gemmatimonadaceae bacterium]|nr:flippase-like domain-containing protein [Gemmatimonadaceae bacterium]